MVRIDGVKVDTWVDDLALRDSDLWVVLLAKVGDGVTCLDSDSVDGDQNRLADLNVLFGNSWVGLLDVACQKADLFKAQCQQPFNCAQSCCNSRRRQKAIFRRIDRDGECIPYCQLW